MGIYKVDCVNYARFHVRLVNLVVLHVLNVGWGIWSFMGDVLRSVRKGIIRLSMRVVGVGVVGGSVCHVLVSVRDVRIRVIVNHV